MTSFFKTLPASVFAALNHIKRRTCNDQRKTYAHQVPSFDWSSTGVMNDRRSTFGGNSWFLYITWLSNVWFSSGLFGGCAEGSIPSRRQIRDSIAFNKYVLSNMLSRSSKKTGDSNWRKQYSAIGCHLSNDFYSNRTVCFYQQIFCSVLSPNRCCTSFYWGRTSKNWLLPCGFLKLAFSHCKR